MCKYRDGSVREGPIAAVWLAAAIALAWFLRHALLLIYVSIIFAVVFSPAVGWIERRSLGRWSPGRGTALLLLIAAVLLAIGSFSFFALPPIISDIRSISTDLPSNVRQLADKIRELPFGNTLASHVTGSSLQHAIAAVSSRALAAFKGVTGAIAGLITVALLTSYFILDGDRVFRWAKGFVPANNRDRLVGTALRSRDSVQRWLAGQMILMLILGGSTGIVLGLLGVRYFYAIGVFASVANFVPVLGPIATVIVAGCIAALDGWMKVLGVVIFYFVYQQVENAFLTPRIVGSTVGLPGVAILVALVIGSELAGVVGAIVAVPSAALVATFADEYGREPDAGSRPQRDIAA